MRIVQIIDSLEPGGAERMAVNYANSLSRKIDFSGLVSTRNEGLLLNQIDEKVSYLFLQRKKSIDLQAVLRLRNYLKKNKVDIIQAHSSSFFIAVLVKLTFFKVKIIWHDHYGISQDLTSRKNISLKLGSVFFKGIVSVNSALKIWADAYLFCSNNIYFPNFIDQSVNSPESIALFGLDKKRIICLANLRSQKNHELLLKAASLTKKKYPEWSFHLLGKDFKDSYSDKLKKIVSELKLHNTVFFYGAVQNTGAALKQCDIAVLPSLSEGLPLAILEYGLFKLPVIATKVGQNSEVISSHDEGILIDSDNVNQLVQAILQLISDETMRKDKGIKLNEKILCYYSETVIVEKYLLWLNPLHNFASQNSIIN